MDLSVIIPARNEMFLARTIEDIVTNSRANTEVIAILDGAWAAPPIVQHQNVQVIYLPQSIGQRAATNLGARVSTARYIMKADGHCAFAEGFDAQLIADAQTLGENVTQIPAQYNLHVFDWRCPDCGHQTYQGPTPTECVKCKQSNVFERVIVWKPRLSRRTEFWRFDSTLHFQYWGAYKERPEAQGDICDVMTSLGACFFMSRDRFFEIDGLDEAHGSWGQFGVEIGLKSWLSGGRHVVNKKTWFAHMFRTQGKDFSFPYPLPHKDVEVARARSRELWFGNSWEKAVLPLSWVIEKFAPVPGWENVDLAPYSTLANKQNIQQAPAVITPRAKKRGYVYYSDSRIDERLAMSVRRQLERATPDFARVHVTLKPTDVQMNVIVPLERGYLTMFKQILLGLEVIDADIVFLVEHDVLYHPSHFTFTPTSDTTFYYNQNTWKVDVTSGRALHYLCNQTSGLCASRSLLLEHYRARVARVEREGFTRSMGFEPGTHSRPRGIDDYPHETWMSDAPNVDIRHTTNLTQSRWSQEQFRNKKYCQGWTEAESVPHWGRTFGRFDAFLDDIDK